MVKLRRILSNRNRLRCIVISFIILLVVVGLVLQAFRSLNSPYPKAYFFINYIYFTTQSNILVLALLILHFTRFKNTRLFEIFTHIALLNILMTGAIFHLFLGPYMELTIVQYLLHTATPLSYLFYYFVIYDRSFNVKYLETLFIYPIIYIGSVYTVIEPRIGDTLELVQGDFQGSRFIYPFFDPYYYDFSWFKMAQFFFITIVFVIVATLLITQPTKRYIERKFNEGNPTG
ncbi:MAG: hypothetical protein V3569_00805 [Acholeplasmataceae bacterium]|nr:hypothetical protein [Acholeplasmataceae bacterium]